MQADFHLTLEEFVEALRKYCLEKSGYASKVIYVDSYESTRIVIDETGLVECSQFKHRA